MITFAGFLLAVGCSSSHDGVTDDSGMRATERPTEVTDGGGAGEAAEPTAEALLALVEGCANKLSNAPYAKDVGGTANIHVCGLEGAVYWKADMDIDCDGKRTAVCNENTDPYFQNETATVDSTGKPLDSSTLPHIVVPTKSSRWDYRASDLRLGNAALVIYDGKIQYGVIGDVGPAAIIGEASYAMAKKLGINPHPSTGGTSSGVTYIAFKGTSAKVAPIEDQAKAVALGKQLAQKLLSEN